MVAMLLSIVAAGCASGHHHSKDRQETTGSASGQPDQRIVIVDSDESAGQPPMRDDPVSAQPNPNAVWTAGHWLRDQQANAWVWVPGRWR
jgi:hypothetical protein